MSVPPIAVSMGDPAGIGPEIVVKAWASGRAPAFFAIGDPQTYARAGATVRTIAGAAEAAALYPDALPVLPEPLAETERPGQPDVANAHAIIAAIRRGTELALSGAASALVTCPIAKATLYAADFPYPGHTEFVAALTAGAPMQGPRGPVMMLAGAELRVALATIHTPLKAVPAALSQARIVETARVVHAALRRDFAIERPRIAIAALNPHAGEAGGIGREEIEIINPAAAALRAEGIAATDAKPADTLFHPEARRTYDAVLAMYHDQGLIPLKMLHFWDAVNLTLGLPIVRASPDHGTGFDIAGKGIAREDSFLAALHMAAAIAARRKA